MMHRIIIFEHLFNVDCDDADSYKIHKCDILMQTMIVKKICVTLFFSVVWYMCHKAFKKVFKETADLKSILGIPFNNVDKNFHHKRNCKQGNNQSFQSLPLSHPNGMWNAQYCRWLIEVLRLNAPEVERWNEKIFFCVKCTHNTQMLDFSLRFSVGIPKMMLMRRKRRKVEQKLSRQSLFKKNLERKTFVKNVSKWEFRNFYKHLSS